MNGRNAVVMARRNQVSADEAVRAGTADEKRASQHPERGGLNSHAQRGYRGERSPCFGLITRLLPLSEQAQIGGPIPHENQDDHENQDGRRRDDHLALRHRAVRPDSRASEDELPRRVDGGGRTSPTLVRRTIRLRRRPRAPSTSRRCHCQRARPAA